MTEPKIKHLVISGGGFNGFSYYGILKATNKRGMWKTEQLESIYGTSIGSILAVMIAMNFEWELLDNFIIKRTWQTVFPFNVYSLINAIPNCGLYTSAMIDDIFYPLFNAKDVPLDITLQGFYDLFGIELHLFSTCINTFESVDFTHITYPDKRLLDCVYSSAALPILCAPLLHKEIIDGKEVDNLYLDGAIFNNYPIHSCLVKNADSIDSILGICKSDPFANRDIKIGTIFEYLDCLINRLVGLANRYALSLIDIKGDESSMLYKEWLLLKQEYRVFDVNNPLNLLNTFQSMEERKRLIDNGIQLVEEKHS